MAGLKLDISLVVAVKGFEMEGIDTDALKKALKPTKIKVREYIESQPVLRYKLLTDKGFKSPNPKIGVRDIISQMSQFLRGKGYKFD